MKHWSILAILIPALALLSQSCGTLNKTSHSGSLASQKQALDKKASEASAALEKSAQTRDRFDATVDGVRAGTSLPSDLAGVVKTMQDDVTKMEAEIADTTAEADELDAQVHETFRAWTERNKTIVDEARRREQQADLNFHQRLAAQHAGKVRSALASYAAAIVEARDCTVIAHNILGREDLIFMLSRNDVLRMRLLTASSNYKEKTDQALASLRTARSALKTS